MQTLKSDFRALCGVELPYQGRQKYMHTFDLADPKMAVGFEDYFNPVLALCKAAGALQGIAHMTVDEKVIEPGRSQRRPGPHVDGCFIPEKGWGHGGGGGWNHYCNHIPMKSIARMPVIIAASAVGCRAWKGQFDAAPKEDGDLSHISRLLGDGTVLAPNVGYLLSADCVHESLVLTQTTQRSFMRIALPVDFVFNA